MALSRLKQRVVLPAVPCFTSMDSSFAAPALKDRMTSKQKQIFSDFIGYLQGTTIFFLQRNLLPQYSSNVHYLLPIRKNKDPLQRDPLSCAQAIPCNRRHRNQNNP